MENKHIIAQNKYGKYCIPVSSKHRPSCKDVIAGRVWEEETVDYILANCKAGLIHAGAYFGDMLPAFATKIKDVWAFEPNKENYSCAINTIKWNNLSNIHLINAALGETTTTAILQTKRKGKSLGGASQITKDQNNGYTVNVVAVDDIVPNNEMISIIHLDIEHYELQALRGAQRTIMRNSPTLILETKRNVVPPELNQFLTDIGYEMVGNLYERVNSIWKKKT